MSNLNPNPNSNPSLNPFSLVPLPIQTSVNRLLRTSAIASFWLGVQFGSCFLLLLILLLLTRSSKRRTAVFILNALALASSGLRSILSATYFWSYLWAWTYQFADPLDVRYEPVYAVTAVPQSVAALLAATQASCIMASLFLQIRAVCAPMSRLWTRRAVLGASGTLAVLNIALHWFLAVLDIMFCIVSPGSQNSARQEITGWWHLGVWVFFGSVGLFSGVFVGKLGVAVLQRRRLGIKGFGAMHVVMIMGAQTMVVPAITAVASPYNAYLSSWVNLSMTWITITLPLSAVWAAEVLPEQARFNHERNLERLGAPPHSAISVVSFRTKLFGSRGGGSLGEAELSPAGSPSASVGTHGASMLSRGSGGSGRSNAGGGVFARWAKAGGFLGRTKHASISEEEKDDIEGNEGSQHSGGARAAGDGVV